MVTDSIEVQISSSAKQAVDSLDKLSAKLDEVFKSIMGIGNAKGLENLASVFDNISPTIKEINANVAKMGKELDSTLANFASKYKDLGKDFQFFGDKKSIEKQIERYSNALETAKLKKEDLEKSGKISGQAYEDAVKDTIKYSNILESLKKQLKDIQTAQANFDIKVNLADAERTLESFREQLSDFDKIIEAGGAETEAGLSFPVSGLEMSLEQLRSLYPEAHELISSFEAEIERANELSRKAPVFQYGEIDLSAFEQATQKIAEDIGVNSQMMKDFRESLNQLVIPPIQTQSLDKLYGELNKTEQKIEELRAKLENGITMGRITESVDDSGFRNLQEQIALAEQKAEALKTKIAEVGTQSVSLDTSSVNVFSTALSKLGVVANVVKKGLSGFASAIKKVVSAIGKGLGKLGSFTKSLLSLSRSGKNMSVSLAGGFGTVLKYGLGFTSVRALINKFTGALKDGMKNLAQFSGEVNSNLSMLQNSVNQAKNALAAALAPALNALAPIINNVIQYIIKLINSFGQLTASLTGSSSWTKAKQLTDSFADSAKGAGKAAEKAMKGIRAFDELNTITMPEQSGGGETSGADMFEVAEVEDKFKNIAEWIKEMWKNADFTGLGALLGTQLKNGLDNIPWESIQNFAERLGKSVATLINGFVEVEGLGYSVGSTIGELVNTYTTGMTAFFDNTHWDSVGQFIGESLNGIVDTIDWEGLGHLFSSKWNAIFEVIDNAATTFDWSNFGLRLSDGVNTAIADFDWVGAGESLSNLAKGLFDSIIMFLENTNWQELGNGIADFIGSIDWGGLVERLAEGIGAALGALAALLWGLIQDAWNSVVDWWKETAFEDGQFTMSGLLNGIWEGIKNIGTWIYEHIFKPFIDGFKKAFGIASPSKVMLEMGSFLMQGLFNGVSSLIEKVVGIFSKLKEKIINIWNILKERTTAIWNGIKDAIKVPINGILGFINGLVGGVESGLNFMINALNKLKFDVPDWVPVIGGSTFGFNIPTIDIPEIPLLAKGGVTISETLAMIGEQGKEAVLPLTNSTAMKEIADAISVPLMENLNSMPRYTVSEKPTPYQPSYSAISVQLGGYNGGGFGGSSSSEIRSIMYSAVFDAVSASLDGSRAIQGIREDIQRGHVVEVTDDQIGKAAQRFSRDYMRRTGNSAYAF